MTSTEEMIESRVQFGQRVRKYRKEQNLTQTELGQVTGLDRWRISRIECGKGNATFDTILMVANGLGTSPSILLAGIGIPFEMGEDPLPIGL